MFQPKCTLNVFLSTISYVFFPYDLAEYHFLGPLLGARSLLVFVFNRTWNKLLGESLWESTRMQNRFIFLWRRSHKIHSIVEHILPYTGCKCYNFWLWDIPWCSSVWCCRIKELPWEVLLLFLVGIAESKVSPSLILCSKVTCYERTLLFQGL